MRKAAIGLLRLYQSYLRVFFMPCCRYHPSCSDYTLQAIEHYGILKGLIMGMGRLARCSGYSRGGYDPVN